MPTSDEPPPVPQSLLQEREEDMAKRKELDELLRLLNLQRGNIGRTQLEFYITRPGDRYGRRYQLKWINTGSNVSNVMSGKEMEQVLRVAITLGDIRD